MCWRGGRRLLMLSTFSMSYDLKRLPTFDRQVKRLAKKYPSLKDDLLALFTALQEDPMQGNGLGKGCYKVRMSTASKGQETAR